ncbi:imidazoleglycerol-phosphate dehydratase HisB [bacterium]
MKNRTAQKERKTKETNINLNINLDGKGDAEINTGISFFDHMLELFARHSLCDLAIDAKGDLEIDEHHLIEDMGIVLGEALKEAIGDKKGINRYGFMILPMDDTLVEVVLDLSNRPFYVSNFDKELKNLAKDDKDRYELYEHFFQSLAINAGMTLHINLKYGKNFHHIVESIFKCFAHALRKAIESDPRSDQVPSTKGTL